MPYRYYNPLAYEKDVFSEDEVRIRTDRWKTVLGLKAATISETATIRSVEERKPDGPSVRSTEASLLGA